MVKAKVNRRHGRKLVELTDEDEWEKCLAILLQRKALLEKNSQKQNRQSQQRLVWLGATTEGGDGLIHLASFAACDASMVLVNRQRALQCLELILEAEMFTINRPAGDGGTALHSAMAAASSSLVLLLDGNSRKDEVDEDNDDATTSDEDESDDDASQKSLEDNDDELLSGFEGLGEDEELYRHFKSEEITYKAIQTLLDYGADPDLPLTAPTLENDEDDDNDGEMELSYAREAIEEQWTPFTMALQWCILAGIEATAAATAVAPYTPATVDTPERQQFVLALTILRSMLDSGANPTYPIGANVQWNAFEFLASASHRLSFASSDSKLISVSKKVFSSSDGMKQENTSTSQNDSSSATSSSSSSTSDTVAISVHECVESLLLQFATTGTEMTTGITSTPLSPDQKSAVAILANNPPDDKDQFRTTTTIILESNNKRRLNEILPLPQAFWSNGEQRKTWTLLEGAVAVLADKSVNYLLHQQQSSLSEKNVIRAFEILFASNVTAIQGKSIQKIKQEEICSLLIHGGTISATPTDNATTPKQQLLDRLLLRACGGTNWGSPHSIHILLSLGADPHTSSITKAVQGGFVPLHFVAANYRGRKGMEMTKELLTAAAAAGGANAMMVPNDAGDTPLDMALTKRNFGVVQELWHTAHHQVGNNSNDDGTALLPKLSPRKAFALGEAAIACQDLSILQDSVNILRKDSGDLVSNSTSGSTATTDKDSWSHQSRLLGKLLLLCIDERSGLGGNTSTKNFNKLLIDAIDIILGPKEEEEHHSNYHPCSFEVDEISNHSPLHLVLRSDRGQLLRDAVVPRLCQLARRVDQQYGLLHDQDGHPTVNRVSLRCDVKFGCYSALSLACALHCETSIQTLLEYGADPYSQDSQQLCPKDLVQEPTQLSLETLTLLVYNDKDNEQDESDDNKE